MSPPPFAPPGHWQNEKTPLDLPSSPHTSASAPASSGWYHGSKPRLPLLAASAAASCAAHAACAALTSAAKR